MANSKWETVSERRQNFVNALIADMEKGVIPWEKPWIANLPQNASSGKLYRGINSLTLGFTADKFGYTDPRWCTYKQAQDNGWSVKTGEKATFIEYWEWYNKIPVLDENGKQKVDEDGKKVFELKKRNQPICVSHAVFNAQQIDGIPVYEKQVANQWNSIETAEKILTNSGAIIEHKQSNNAYYSLSTDSITLPLKEQFKSPEGYYGTALHELSHWTRHPTRLNRERFGEFGSPEYAKEELRAELSSAFLNSELGIKREFSDSAAYLLNWIAVLRHDKDELYKAAYDAEKIANYIMEFSKEKELTQEIEGGIMDAKVNVNQAEQAPPDTLLGHLAEGVKETLSQDILADDTLVGYAVNNVKESIQSATAAVSKPEKIAPCDVRLNVSYEQREAAKALGAKFSGDANKNASTWYIPKGEELSKFAAYLPPDGKLYAVKDTPITVDYNAREAAKEKGAWWNTETKQWYIPKGAEVTKFDTKYFEPAPEKLKIVTKTFEDFAREKGLIIDEAIGDGKMHRVAVEGGKHGTKDGAYLVYDDDKGRAGYVQNFKTGEKATFAEKGESFTLSETDRTEIAKAVEIHKAEIRVRQDSKAKSAAYLTEFRFTQAEASHPYLQAKGVQPHNARFDTEGKLIVPLKNINGETRSWQTIESSGAKHFLPDGQLTGCFHQVGNGNLKNSKDIIICEGFATGASLHEATNKPVLCAMQAGNLKKVAEVVREKYGDQVNIIIAGDNDHKQPNNPGRTAAEDAAKAVNGKVRTPEFTPKEKEKGLSDFNDLAASRGKAAVKEQLSTAMTRTKHNEQQLCG
jgi:antirestriction protein ArdC/phage/plasmid primase-like uncharacterized protein